MMPLVGIRSSRTTSLSGPANLRLGKNAASATVVVNPHHHGGCGVVDMSQGIVLHEIDNVTPCLAVLVVAGAVSINSSILCVVFVAVVAIFAACTSTAAAVVEVKDNCCHTRTNGFQLFLWMPLIFLNSSDAFVILLGKNELCLLEARRR